MTDRMGRMTDASYFSYFIRFIHRGRWTACSRDSRVAWRAEGGRVEVPFSGLSVPGLSDRAVRTSGPARPWSVRLYHSGLACRGPRKPHTPIHTHRIACNKARLGHHRGAHRAMNE